MINKQITIETQGEMKMGTIVCQVCEGTIGHFEDEKSTVLYGKCGSHCECDHKEHTKA